MRNSTRAAVFTFSLLVAGCGDPRDERSAGSAVPEAARAQAEPSPIAVESVREAPARPDADGRLRIEVDDRIRYSVTRFEVVTGERVTLELVHTGQLSKQAMGHNVVILAPGTDLTAFALSAATARATDFIPGESDEQILAHTELIGGGETTALDFVAPAPGRYEYLCTFPGHFGMMRGEMIVLARGDDVAAELGDLR